MSGSMEGNAVSFKGGVFSPYLTTRLPAWAGVRQNVMGSNVDGRPVAPANSATLTCATVGSSVDTAAAAAASGFGLGCIAWRPPWLASSGTLDRLGLEQAGKQSAPLGWRRRRNGGGCY